MTFLGLGKLSAVPGPFLASAVGIAGVAVVASVALFALPRYWRWRKARRWLDGVEMAAIDEMPGLEFERACAEIFRRLGFDVTTTKASGDQGADLVLEAKDRRIVVQAKRRRSKVGNVAVQEVVAAKAFYQADAAAVVTNHYYSPAAIKLARANAVLLLDRRDLAAMLARAAKARKRRPAPARNVAP